MSLRSKTINPHPADDDYLKASISCDTEMKKKSDERYVYAPIDKFGIVGRWFRHKLLDGILVGTPVILTIQKHRTPNRTILMKALSFLGTEDFYTMLFLCITWLLDQRLGRLFGVLLWVGFYITGFLKTLFCLPRPPSPPVIPLEKAFDWALPSHHSLLGVIMPWYIWLYATLHYELSPFNRSILCALIVLWSFGVMLSRLYLGVHSPADIVCGGVVGVLILSLWVQADDYVDFYISQQRLEPQLKLLAFCFLMLCLHPIVEAGNSSFLDTCVLHGVVSGIILARSQRSRILGSPPLLETISGNFCFITFLKLSFLRVLLGGIIIFLLRICLKIIFINLVEHLYRLIGLPRFNSSCYRKSMPPNPKHYTKEFKLPPEEKSSDLDLTDESEPSTSNDITADGEISPSKDDLIDDDLDEPKWFQFIQISNTLHSLTSKTASLQPWDVTVPVKLIVYFLVTFTAVEVLPHLFVCLGI